MSEMTSILMVDDILANRKIAGKILAGHFIVDTVKSGEEALDFFTKKIPDLVLLDIHMEGIDGFEVLRRMKDYPATAEIPVIFLTADDDHEVEADGFKAGVVDFITKPFIPAIMLQRVQRAMSLSLLSRNLQREVEKQTERVHRLSLQLIQVLVNTIEARDRRLNGHSVRVANYAWEIARRLGLPKEQQEMIFYAGMLHNIGKIGIPDNLVNKKEHMTAAEWEVVQQATIIGGDILKDVTELPDLWKGARYYKENYDGTGYPDGLKGKAIPEIARIIAVACAYDTMKEIHAMIPMEIHQSLEKGRGTKFDPDILDIVYAMMEA